MKVYIQSKRDDIVDITARTVYNMLLHNDTHLQKIKRKGWKFMLVHGGLQGKMAPIDDIIHFSLKNRPELIIAPDRYRDQKYTTRMTREYVEVCPSKLLDKSAAVVQTRRNHEIRTVLSEYRDLGFSWVAVPSDNTRAMESIPELKEDGWKVHILGTRVIWNVVREAYNADSIDIVTDSIEEVNRWCGCSLMRSIPVAPEKQE